MVTCHFCLLAWPFGESVMLTTRTWSVGWLVRYRAWLDDSWVLLEAGNWVLIRAGQTPSHLPVCKQPISRKLQGKHVYWRDTARETPPPVVATSRRGKLMCHSGWLLFFPIDRIPGRSWRQEKLHTQSEQMTNDSILYKKLSNVFFAFKKYVFYFCLPSSLFSEMLPNVFLYYYLT